LRERERERERDGGGEGGTQGEKRFSQGAFASIGRKIAGKLVSRISL